MTASKTDVWREFVDLISRCPTEHLTVLTCLLFHLLDHEGLDDHCLMESITKARADMEDGFEREKKSWA
jgi:hypothetical protein